MSRFDSILFDFDGVLADTEPIHWACWAEVLQPHGVLLDWQYYCDCCIGVDDRKMLQAMANRADPPADWRRLFEEYPRKKELFRSRTLANPPFAPELVGLLEAWHRDYRMAIVTSSARSEVEPLIVAGGLRGHFDALVGAEDVIRYKPDPEPYLKAAELIGGVRPLVLEDSAAGLASGRAAGFEVLRVADAAEMPALLKAALKAKR
jgi:beta-phosphoglucomutase